MESGILLGRMVGQSRMIRVNTHHELYSPLSDLLLATYGPKFFLEPLVAALPEVDQREDGYCMIARCGGRSFPLCYGGFVRPWGRRRVSRSG